MFSAILIAEFFIGIYISIFSSELLKIVFIIIGFILILIEYLIIIKSSIGALSLRKKVGTSIMLTLNLLFSFIINIFYFHHLSQDKYIFIYIYWRLLKFKVNNFLIFETLNNYYLN